MTLSQWFFSSPLISGPKMHRISSEVLGPSEYATDDSLKLIAKQWEQKNDEPCKSDALYLNKHSI